MCWPTQNVASHVLQLRSLILVLSDPATTTPRRWRSRCTRRNHLEGIAGIVSRVIWVLEPLLTVHPQRNGVQLGWLREQGVHCWVLWPLQSSNHWVLHVQASFTLRQAGTISTLVT